MKLFTLILFLGISVSVFSQTNYDKRLLAKFSQEQITDMAVNQRSILNYWTYYLDNGYKVVDVPSGKNMDEYPEITYKSAEKFNILKLNTQISNLGQTYFRIKNSNQLLILDSSSHFIQKYNAYRAQN